MNKYEKTKKKSGRIQTGQPLIAICTKKILSTELTEEKWHV